MRSFRFLVFFPRLDQCGSGVVVQVNAAARRVIEVCGSDLSAAYQRHHEPIRQCPQLFRQIECEGGPAGPRAVEEPHLVVETDTLQRTTALGHQQPVAVAQHRVDGVARRSPRPRRESQLGRRHGLLHRPEVNPGCIPFDAAHGVARHRISQSRNSLPDLLAPVGESLACRRIPFVTRPAADDPSAVLQFCRHNSPRQLERAGFIHNRIEESGAKVNVAVGGAAHEETHGTAPVQGRDAYAPSHTCIQCLHGDLRPAQYHQCVDRLERDTLAPIG